IGSDDEKKPLIIPLGPELPFLCHRHGIGFDVLAFEGGGDEDGHLRLFGGVELKEHLLQGLPVRVVDESDLVDDWARELGDFSKEEKREKPEKKKPLFRKAEQWLSSKRLELHLRGLLSFGIGGKGLS